jgi:uncharacterized protein
MSKPVVKVNIRAIAATSGGFAVFLDNQEKASVIFVDQSVGAAVAMFMQGTQKERPLTHDVIVNILRALGAKIERVIVNDLKLGTYYARLVLRVIPAYIVSVDFQGANDEHHLNEQRGKSTNWPWPEGLA